MAQKVVTFTFDSGAGGDAEAASFAEVLDNGDLCTGPFHNNTYGQWAVMYTHGNKGSGNLTRHVRPDYAVADLGIPVGSIITEINSFTAQCYRHRNTTDISVTHALSLYTGTTALPLQTKQVEVAWATATYDTWYGPALGPDSQTGLNITVTADTLLSWVINSTITSGNGPSNWQDTCYDNITATIVYTEPGGGVDSEISGTFTQAAASQSGEISVIGAQADISGTFTQGPAEHSGALYMPPAVKESARVPDQDLYTMTVADIEIPMVNFVVVRGYTVNEAQIAVPRSFRDIILAEYPTPAIVVTQTQSNSTLQYTLFSGALSGMISNRSTLILKCSAAASLPQAAERPVLQPAYIRNDGLSSSVRASIDGRFFPGDEAVFRNGRIPVDQVIFYASGEYQYMELSRRERVH